MQLAMSDARRLAANAIGGDWQSSLMSQTFVAVRGPDGNVRFASHAIAASFALQSSSERRGLLIKSLIVQQSLSDQLIVFADRWRAGEYLARVANNRDPIGDEKTLILKKQRKIVSPMKLVLSRALVA